MNGPGTEAVLSPTVNTEGEKDGGVGRNAILQRSLFNSTSPLSIPYIFFIHITRIDLVTILRFSHLKLNQIPSFSFVNSKRIVEKFQIQNSRPKYYNISNRARFSIPEYFLSPRANCHRRYHRG